MEISPPAPQRHRGDLLTHVLFFSLEIPHADWEVEGDLRSRTSDIITNYFCLLLVHTPSAQVQRKPRKLVKSPSEFQSKDSVLALSSPPVSLLGVPPAFSLAVNTFGIDFFSVGKDSI